MYTKQHLHGATYAVHDEKGNFICYVEMESDANNLLEHLNRSVATEEFTFEYNTWGG